MRPAGSGKHAGAVSGFSVGAKFRLLTMVISVAIMGAIGFIFFETLSTGRSIDQQARSLRTMLLVSDTGRALARFKFWSFEFQATWLETSEDEFDKAYENLKGKLKVLKPHAPKRTAVLAVQMDRLATTAADAVDSYINGQRDKGVELTARSRKIIEKIDAVFEPISEELRARVIEAGAAVSESRRRTQIATIVTAAVVAGFMFLLSVLIRLVVTRPLKRTTDVLRLVADGDTDFEVPDVGRGDEIGDIARAIKVFKTSLIENERLQTEQRDAERQALDGERRRAETIETRTRAFEQEVTATLNSFSSSASQLTSSAQTMSVTAEETGRQSQSAAAGAEQTSADVKIMATATDQLANSVREIDRQVTKSNEIATHAVDEVERTNQQVQGLVDAAQKIGEVIELINDIAKQTNLLALNATIESARAGEAGKGFAVVASEVQELAKQTASATQEIDKQISGIQDATQNAVDAINGIDGTIREISQIASVIADAIEEQGVSTQEIASRTENVASGTHDVSRNITGVNDSIGQTREVSGQVLSAADDLSNQSEILRGEVDRFLIDINAA
jgi:methyl-accepting chemotaxis protein